MNFLIGLSENFHFSVNNIYIKNFFGVHPYFIVVGVFFVLVALLWLITAVRKGALCQLDIKKLIIRSLMIIAVLFMCIEGVLFFNLSVKLCFLKKGDLSAVNKNFYLTQIFSDSVKAVLPERCQAEFVTDFDLSHDPGDYILRALAYHLYPIDIRDIRQGEKECLIFLKKENWQAHVPEGFVAVAFTETEGVAYRKSAGETR